jgi:hypothetical protein
MSGPGRGCISYRTRESQSPPLPHIRAATSSLVRFTLLLLVAVASHAATNGYKQEANNKPSNANAIGAPVTVFGTMRGKGEDQTTLSLSDELIQPQTE